MTATYAQTAYRFASVIVVTSTIADVRAIALYGKSLTAGLPIAKDTREAFVEAVERLDFEDWRSMKANLSAADMAILEDAIAREVYLIAPAGAVEAAR